MPIAVGEYLVQAGFELGDAGALGVDVCFFDLVGKKDVFHLICADEVAVGAQQVGGGVQPLIQRHTHPQAKFGVVFKEGV